MKPSLVLVGRPNVGKSTLFNRLTQTRAALVAAVPGLTRDRHYGHGRLGGRSYVVVDTGGLEPQAAGGLVFEVANQTRLAIAEADVVVLLTDGRAGLTPKDVEVSALLRESGRRCIVAVNKCEGMQEESVTAEFHELGLGEPLAISAAHGLNVGELVDRAFASFPPEQPEEEDRQNGRIKVAVVGRPNVGKSTLINSILGEERMIAFDQPGTTRDSIYVDFDRRGQAYTLIDTAGVRRRGKIDAAIEKFSVIKTLQAVDDANVVVLLLDAEQGIAEQDAHIAGFVLEAGRAVVVAVNKWDSVGTEARSELKRELDRKLAFLDFAKQHFISASKGRGIAEVLASVRAAYEAAMIKLPTPRLTRALQAAVQRQQPPRSGMTRPKLRYAHQGGTNPPVVIIHGSALQAVPPTYRRYLERFFCDTFKLRGTPLEIQFRTAFNPYRERDTRR